MYVFALLSLLLIVAVNYILCPDFKYPPLIMAVWWLGMMLLVYLSPIDLSSVSSVTAFVVVGALAAFTIGGWSALPAKSTTHASFLDNSGGRPSAHPRLRRVFLIASAVLLVVVFKVAIDMVENSSPMWFLSELRSELLSEGSTGYGALGNASILSFLTTFIYSIELRKSRWERIEYYLSVLISFGFAVLITGRTPILLLIVGLLAVAGLRGRLNRKKAVIGSSVFLCSFAVYAVLLAKGGNVDSSLVENVGSVGESLISYCVGPVAAFDHLLKADEPLRYGHNSFAAFINPYYRLAGQKEISPIQEKVFVPFEINVYTALQPLYADFGLLGIVVGFYLLGFSAAFVYTRAIQGDRFYILCYAIMLFCIIYSVFSDQWFAPLVSWIKYVVAAYLYFRADRKRQPTFGAGTAALVGPVTAA